MECVATDIFHDSVRLVSKALDLARVLPRFQ